MRVLLLVPVLAVACSSEPEQATVAEPLPSGTTNHTSSSTARMDLGGCTVLPKTSPWNTDISAYPLHPRSDAFIASIGRDEPLHPDFGTEYDGEPIGIPYVVVPKGQRRVPVKFTLYASHSYPGPYPLPADAPIEGGEDSEGDRHVVVIERGTCHLFELFGAFCLDGGERWKAASGAMFDLAIDTPRTEATTSADAAGLPIFPGLVRYDEVVQEGEIRHALRFTVSKSQAAYVAPATHYASSDKDPNLPPMGLRVRMKASYDCSKYSSEVQVICAALKRYGMFLADNGTDWYISGTPDPRWDDDALSDLKRISGSALEVVETGPIEHY
jgi:hypothetical protein